MKCRGLQRKSITLQYGSLHDPLGICRLHDKSLCSYCSYTRKILCLCESILSHKQQRASCSRCHWALPRCPIQPAPPDPGCCEYWRLMAPSYPSYREPSSPHRPASTGDTDGCMTLWYNLCSRAPRGIRLKLMSTETIS